MLAWLEGPRTSYVDGDSAGISRESLYQRLRSTLSNIAVHSLEDSGSTLRNPYCNSSVKKGDLGKVVQFQMEPDGNYDKYG